MDRIDALRVFIAALDEGSLAAAGRHLSRSPASVTRAIAALEAHIGVRLLERTTRMLRLTEAGERYATACRRVLADLAEADMLAAGERTAPRGMLTLTAPVVAGTRILRPVIDSFLNLHPDVTARLLLLDRAVNMIEEGVDIALRIAHLPDSSLIATRIGSVRRVVCASPEYLARHRPIIEPADLAHHRSIALTQFKQGDAWTFPPSSGSTKPRQVQVRARMTVNTIEAAVSSALEGYGVTRVFCYQIAQEVSDGRLAIVLNDAEPEPLPVHIIAPDGRLTLPKVRAFFDFAAPSLRTAFSKSVGTLTVTPPIKKRTDQNPPPSRSNPAKFKPA